LRGRRDDISEARGDSMAMSAPAVPTGARPPIARSSSRGLGSVVPALLRRRWDAPGYVVAAAAVASAALAVLLSRTAFSHLSVNNDESVYLLQAKSLANGHLFPKAPHPAASFAPWLGVTHGGHYVLKYTPVVAGFFALSILTTGGFVAGLAVLAAALVAATFLLAGEVTGSRPVAATAAVLLAASPVVIVQSALILPYVLFLVLAELALWAMFAGARRDSAAMLAFAGCCAGLGFAARTYDALLMLGPAAAWLTWRIRAGRLRLLAGFVGGAAAPAAGLLWFDNAATGSALRLPFSLFQSGDTLGFGVHRLYPGEVGRRFGIGQGWQGLSRHLELLGGGWVFGGVLVAALAAVALWRRRASAEVLAVLAGGLLLVAGYLFFWGIWNAGIVWGAVRYLGPYYLMPVLVPLTILAALGLQEIASARRRRAISAVVLAAAVSAVAIIPALRSDVGLNADNARLARAVAGQGRSLVFVDTYPGYLQHPTSVISNNVPVGGRTVYALARGADDFAVLRAFPGRPLYRLRLLGEYGKLPRAGYGARLEHVVVVSGRRLTFSFRVKLARSRGTARLDVAAGLLRRSWSLGSRRSGQFQLVLGPGDDPPPGYLGSIVLTVSTASPSSGILPRHVLDHLVLPLAVSADGALRSLVPEGVITELGPLPPPPLSIAVSG
jgi:4-amino-4-deoxy-L-arabinose transferase-like glycosyltransferase